MQFQHLTGTGLLVQEVDVLRDDSMDDALFFEPCKSLVYDVGLLLVEIVEEVLGVLVVIARVSPEVVDVEKFSGIDVFAVVEPAHAAEVRNTGKRGDACSREDHGMLRILEKFGERHLSHECRL